ncbi:PAS domain S-box protein [Synechocystis sp. PCC 7509]|uniref:PAS domain S-box protein n=1 Tax=Synechocystis sp. PCC 7509 TaxID=927677 RepID=UPI0002AC6036|nr:PAS domain S-box protein [Synechocystis sp. PCC 7509]
MNFDEIKELELLSWGFECSLHPEDRDRLLATRQQAISQNQPYQITFRLQATDGSYNSFLEQAILVGDRWVVSCTQQNFNPLGQLPQFATPQPTSLGVIEWNLDFEVVKWDAAAEAIFGYSNSEAIGRHATNLIVTASSKEQVDRVWRELVQRRGGTRSINENITKEGKIIICEWYNQPLIDRNREILGVTSLVTDITDRTKEIAQISAFNTELEQRVLNRTAQLDELSAKQLSLRVEAEANKKSHYDSLEALRQSEERYRSLVIATSQIVWTTDAQGQVVDMPHWRNYTGQSQAEVKGWGWLAAVHPEDRERTATDWNQALETKSLYDTEYRIRATDGNYRYFAVRGVPVIAPDGTIREWVGVCTDIQERKTAEAALTARANELAYLTAILTQTNTVLEKRNQELDQFAYVTSHDLKAPLRAIANLSQWIEEDISDVLTDDTRHQMDLLRGRVHRMEALINGLLQFSRSGRVTADKSSVSVASLLAEIIDSLAPPPSFTVEIAPNMPTLVTERLPLEQVFSNLIGNAIKHHPRPDGKVQVFCQDLGTTYEFTVADDGKGIAPEYHEKIFGIFQTLEARDRNENTGIGLAIVKKIVENYGGKIKIDSQESQGASFSFTWNK